MAKLPYRLTGLVVLLGSVAAATTARAELTTTKGADYAALCYSRGVPLPPPFGGTPNAWTRSGPLVAPAGVQQQSFNDDKPVDIWYYQQTFPHPGLCMAAPRASGSSGATTTDFFGVICQATNGKVCFWDQANQLPNGFPAVPFQWDPNQNVVVVPQPMVIATTNPNGFPPPTGPFWVGGADLAGGDQGACSTCHAGENAFNNHPGTATDLLNRHLITGTNPSTYWWPAYWPDPIVPSYDLNNTQGPWPQNPGPGTYSGAAYPGSACFACHVAGGLGGRFPTISSELYRYCSVVLDGATFRLNKTCTGTWNFGGPWQGGDITCPTGAMPPSNTATTSNSSSDPFAHAMDNIDCQAAPIRDSKADWQSPYFNNGSANYGGYGYAYPQGPTMNPPTSSQLGRYYSVYNRWLSYGSAFTELEPTSTHFCWTSGFYVTQDNGTSQPSPLPTMHLDIVGPYWALVGANPTSNSSIEAQCVSWQAISGSALTNHNSRGLTPAQAMATRVEGAYAPGAIQSVAGSSPSSVCFVSGIDGEFISNGDSTQASITLWWPGETWPGTYTGDGTHWQVQVANSPTEQFYNAHVTCIDIGLTDTFDNEKSVDWLISGIDWAAGWDSYPMADVYENACLYSELSASGTNWFDVITNQHNDWVGGYPNSWVIGNAYTWNSDVVYQQQNCLSFAP